MLSCDAREFPRRIGERCLIGQGKRHDLFAGESPTVLLSLNVDRRCRRNIVCSLFAAVSSVVLCAVGLMTGLPLSVQAETVQAETVDATSGDESKEQAELHEHFSGTPAVPRRVRHVIIEVRDIFDEPDLGFFYRAVNNLKVSSREHVVRQELLLNEGDTYDHFLLLESERNLRSLPFLRRVSITPVVEGDEVDLYVQVQDTWTLFPFVALSSGGGTSRSAIGVTEGNILGYGKRLEMLYADDEGRERIEGVWDDPRVFGSHQRLTLGHFERSDGFRSVVSYGEPFRSLSQETAWGTDTEVFDLVGRLFEATEERYVYRQRRVALSGGYTSSKGNPEVRRRRVSLGYRYTRDRFIQADQEDFEDIDIAYDPSLADPDELAEDRRFSGPFLSYQQIRQDFLSINYVDRFDRVQDFNLGNEFNAQAQFAGEAFDSRQDELLVLLSDNQGWRVTPTSFLRGGVSTNFRVNTEKIDNFFARIEAKYYNIFSPSFFSGTYLGKHTLASALVIDVGENLDRDRELLLGARDGLRGYEDRTFSGDQRIVFNAEDRVLFTEDVFRLVSLGGAVFFDAGGTSRSGVGDIIKDELYADIGIGLRFGLTRSSGGNVIRVDLAFPLRDGPDDSGKFEPRLLITSGQLFSAFLSTEEGDSGGAKVSTGFLP